MGGRIDNGESVVVGPGRSGLEEEGGNGEVRLDGHLPSGGGEDEGVGVKSCTT